MDIGPHQATPGGGQEPGGALPGQHTKPRRVLVVEDEPETRALIHETLSMEGFQVRSSDEAHGVLSLIRRTRPDVLLLDLRLPGLSGVDLLPLLARDAPHLPVVVVSGARDLLESHGPDLRRLGATVLEKPFSLDDLVSTVHNAASGRARGPQPTAPLRGVRAPQELDE